jgi:GT2 family glycosyltransferase
VIAVSLILATCGRVSEVRRCLESLAAQSSQDFEILVIDQNPDDRLASIVEEAAKVGLQLRHIRLYPPNLSAARNLGINEAAGDVVAFPDDDCWYEHDVVEKVIQCFSNDESIAGAVGLWVEQTPTTRPTPLGSLSLQQFRRFRDSSASSISLFFRKSVIARLGGFDHRLGVGCWYGAGEETDLVFRVLADGWKIERLVTARVHHAFPGPEPGDIWAAFLKARTRARGTGALYAKHKFDKQVVIRGFLGPIVHAISGQQRVSAAVGTCIGRLEGLIRWRMDQS